MEQNSISEFDDSFRLKMVFQHGLVMDKWSHPITGLPTTYGVHYWDNLLEHITKDHPSENEAIDAAINIILKEQENDKENV